MFEKILVPLDGSENAFEALRAAFDVAKHYQSELVAVVVASDQSYSQYGAVFGGDIMEHLKQQSELTLKKASDEAEKAGVKLATNFEIGVPKQAISVSLPETYHTGLTVIGKTGVHGLSRAVLGSTTGYVVRHSTTPVLVV
ncbi:universal stress protein [Secundilactobacillus kimchicus]|uniref:universal stress protein n=1 Tax=Secundilactobacillus kimchicus TaxID=528209 RepID=UPI001C013C10|nr:universal stress protein [Secundilactobacillus kimchicus]MBT9672077.1 universal stress protein [Secundilactobacillus kimchicus]